MIEKKNKRKRKKQETAVPSTKIYLTLKLYFSQFN